MKAQRCRAWPALLLRVALLCAALCVTLGSSSASVDLDVDLCTLPISGLLQRLEKLGGAVAEKAKQAMTRKDLLRLLGAEDCIVTTGTSSTVANLVTAGPVLVTIVFWGWRWVTSAQDNKHKKHHSSRERLFTKVQTEAHVARVRLTGLGLGGAAASAATEVPDDTQGGAAGAGGSADPTGRIITIAYIGCLLASSLFALVFSWRS
eukprot:TRINITY_DN21941_c0_g1_i1.p1 TRINITY_DN21941_c0_g1~~TRINITY_DN21941_c0_g1_i1.p1  ORF type:complete len:206 (+),score=34.83 TRINITY_DN21941_c0_g1_i1:52-669(+)